MGDASMDTVHSLDWNVLDVLMRGTRAAAGLQIGCGTRGTIKAIFIKRRATVLVAVGTAAMLV